MPLPKQNRLRDPARRVPSTHRASPIRTYVYEQLGISKPGFWADWRSRMIQPLAAGAHDEEEAPEVAEDPAEDYRLAKWPEQIAAQKKHFKNMEFQQGALAEAEKPKNLKHSGDIAALMEKQSKAWFKSNPMINSMSSLSLMGLEKAIEQQEIAALLRGKDQTELSQAGLKSVAQYYVVKAQKRADARAARPFGAGEPTNFDKMYALLESKHTTPIYTPPTYTVLTQGTTTLPKPDPTTTIGALNVSDNGYVSNAKIAPQKMAANIIAGSLKPAKTTFAVAGKLKGAGF